MSDDTDQGVLGRSYAGVTATERTARRRAQLMDAALDLLGEGGPDAVTKRAVCGRAGLNDRYFYEHFANREALLTATAKALTDDGVEALLGATSSAGPHVRDRVLAAAHAALAFMTADPRRPSLLLSAHRSETLQRMRLETQRTVASAMAGVTRELQGDHRTEDPNLELICFTQVSGVMELVAAWLRGDFDKSREDLASLMADILTSYPKSR